MRTNSSQSFIKNIPIMTKVVEIKIAAVSSTLTSLYICLWCLRMSRAEN